MRPSRERLDAEAGATGFRPEVLEKAIRLLSLLEGFQAHPFLKGRLALKGGTALNLFVFDLPRLSIDVDVNYVGAVKPDEFEGERPKVEQAVRAVCSREGLAVAGVPGEHAGGKWHLCYESALGGGGNLELDVNFLFRVPLWPVVLRDSRRVGSCRAAEIPVLDVHELAAGKLVALVARRAARDLFDAHMLLTLDELDVGKLRLGFVLYGAMNRIDWRKVRPGDITINAREVEAQLIPLVRADFLAKEGKSKGWAARLVRECRQKLDVVLPLRANEREFLDAILDNAEIKPELLTADEAMRERIKVHPLLQWKALNVRRHRGI